MSLNELLSLKIETNHKWKFFQVHTCMYVVEIRFSISSICMLPKNFSSNPEVQRNRENSRSPIGWVIINVTLATLKSVIVKVKSDT